MDPKEQKPLKLYEDLIRFAPVPTQFVTKEVMGSSDLVPGADLVVEFGSSIGMEAAAQQIPVITYCTGVAERRQEKASGTRTTELVELRVSDLVRTNDISVMDEESLFSAMACHLLNRDSDVAIELRNRQAAEFPKAERGTAVRKMADALETFTR